MDNEMTVADLGSVDETAENKAVRRYKRNGVELEINPYLPFYEMMEMVGDVVGSCFHGDGDYYPELMDFAFRTNVLLRYTNLLLPDDLEKKYNMVYGTDFVEFVLEHVHQNQLKAIIKAINKKIEYLCSANMNALRSEAARLLESIDRLNDQATEVFTGISADDLKRLIGVVNEYGRFDEEKVVKALTEKGKEEETEADE